MGYRHYFYLVSKDEVEAVRDLSMEELYERAKAQGAETYEEEEGWFYFNDDKFMNKEEIFEFGKLYFDDTAERIYSKGVPLFSQEDVMENFQDYVPFVVGKEGLLEAISIYQEKVVRYYDSFTDDANDALYEMKQKVHRMRILALVNTNEDKKWCMTGSWEYEHSIFNLVHILKTVDWDKYTLLFYGW